MYKANRINLLMAILAGSIFSRFSVVEGEGGGAVPIEDLMDTVIDDLKDLPGFEVPPKGHYKLMVSLEQKMVNDKPGIEAKCEVLETLELANPNDTQVENGTKFSQLFFMDNEWGQGGFKGFAIPIASGLGMVRPTNRQVLERVQNVQISATIGHRYHKEDKQKPVAERRTYADLKNVTVL